MGKKEEVVSRREGTRKERERREESRSELKKRKEGRSGQENEK